MDDHNGPEETFRDTERRLHSRIATLEALLKKAGEALGPFEANCDILQSRLSTAEAERDAAVEAFGEIETQLNCSDSYATMCDSRNAEEVWKIQNSHIREYIRRARSIVANAGRTEG